jgi:hypothetical protein
MKIFGGKEVKLTWLDLDYVWTYSSGPGDLLVEAGDGTSPVCVEAG